MKNTLEVLNKYGLNTQKAMKDILLRNSKRASGNLINSIEYDVNYNDKIKPFIYITYAPYGQFVAGRNQKNKPGNSPTWKSKGSPVNAIKMWLRNKSIAFNSLNRNLNLNKKKLTYEKKLNIMAFIIIRNIKKRGRLNPVYKNPTDFVGEGEKVLMSKSFKRDLRAAQKKDIELELRNHLKNKR